MELQTKPLANQGKSSACSYCNGAKFIVVKAGESPRACSCNSDGGEQAKEFKTKG